MKISLLGGTGDIAEGLVLRWSRAGHEIYIGSRSEEKALGIASGHVETLEGLGIESVSYTHLTLPTILLV